MSIQDKKYEIDLTFEATAAKEGKTLNKPFRTPKGPKKFSVYVKNEKGNVVKVNFGDPNMEIKRDDPNRRKNFRARHNCDNPGPKTKARYWSCKMWEAKKSVTDYTKGSEDWDGVTFYDHEELLKENPSLAFVIEEIMEADCGCGKKCDSEECEKGECGCCGDDEAKADEYSDHEVSMAASQMMKIARQSTQLAMMLREMPESDIMAWAQDKISKAEHYVEAVYDYMMYKNSNAALTEKQKKLPPALQKAILKKQSKGTVDYASLWKNIHNKRERIKKGSGEKMKKKGEKGAPTPEQLKRAKSKTKKLEDHVALPVLKQKQIASDYSELWQKINKKEK